MNPIAIVGMGCRFPGGADEPERFWQLLCQGFDGQTDVPPGRWDQRRFYDPDPDRPGKTYLRKGFFLRQPIDRFDATFFGISPREAAFVDPQQRLLLEIAWEALEDAGLAAGRLNGTPTGVFMGAFALDSLIGQMGANNRHCADNNAATGASLAILANRLSYFFGFRGPSVALDTACSSSLVALHLACRSLQNGECTMALAGGANVMFRPEYPIIMSKARFLSPEGSCKSFDEAADGYGRGEGAGVVVLKTLEAALADGDEIHAVILATAVNQDGRTPGLAVPSGAAQEELLRQAYGAAGVDPEQVAYLEAHGTGTAVGDPIEAQAIGAVLGAGRPADRPLIMSSVKTNIGHLEAAAGVAGVIKAVLCLKHGHIPPHMRLRTPNPRIPFDRLRLRLPMALQPMPDTVGPAVAGVNSFGYGGTNAHAVLQQAPVAAPAAEIEPSSGPHLLPLSTCGKEAMRDLVRAYLDMPEVQQRSPEVLRNLCYSTGLRDSRLDQRVAVVAHSTEELAEQLRAFLDDAPAAGLFHGQAPSRPPRPVFVFTGMGPQWWAMGRGLIEGEPVFRAAVERVDERFRALAPDCSPLRELLAAESDSRMARTEVAQTTSFALQVGLTELLRSWGVTPAAVVGHSVGEVAAAYVAGALSLDDAVSVSYHRGRAQASAAGQGRMLAVGLSEDEALGKLRGIEHLVEIAAVNGPKSITLAGAGPALEQLAKALTVEGVFNRFLAVEVAYHSRHMNPLRNGLLAALRNLRPGLATMPLYSTVTAQVADGTGLDASYWYRNVRGTVRFADAVNRIIDDGLELFVEVGPHPALSSSITQCLRQRGSLAAVVSTLQRNKPDRVALLETLSQLFTVGCPVEWKVLHPQGGRRLRLPAYPWQREYYWSESDESREDRLGAQGHPLLGMTVKAPQPTREAELTAAMYPYLADHCIQGRTVFPGTGYIEAALAIGREATESAGFLDAVEFHKALVIDAQAGIPVMRVSFDRQQSLIHIHGRTRSSQADWTLYASAKFLPARAAAEPDPLPLDELRQRICEEMPATDLYASLRERGLEYGPAFTCVRQLWRVGDEVLARVEVPEAVQGDLEQYHVHPVLLDAAFQALAAPAAEGAGNHGALCLPVAVDRVRVYSKPGSSAWVVGRITRRTARGVEGDLRLCDAAGRLLVEVRGLRFQFLAGDSVGTAPSNWLYGFSWRLQEERPSVPRQYPTGNAAVNGHAKHPPVPGHSLILGDRGELGSKLAADLLRRGDSPVLVSPDGTTDHSSDCRRVAELLASGPWPARVICLWGLDIPAADAGCGPDVEPGAAVFSLLRALAVPREGTAPRLWLVTRGAQQTSDADAPTSPAAAALWGIGRVLAVEHTDLRCSLADLDPAAADASIGMLAAELTVDGPEPELAFRAGACFVRRAERLAQLPEPVVRVSEAPTEDDPSLRLEVGRGGLDSLAFRRNPAREPGPGELTVRVRAAGLNFKDVLKAMGVLSERIVSGTMSGEALGLECAGTVVRVGPGVEKFRVGDEVVACAADCFRTHLTLSSALVFPKLAALSFAEEAALPVVFLTAYYALQEIARLEHGERVLIHAATGGVGLAALQVARRAGAEVFATAGSPEKREYLRELGVEHIMDSRTLEFADQIMEKTGGRGVDVVLNSLSGEALLKSFGVLAAYGRFVEIGKRDIDENNPLRLRPFNRNLSFAAVDIDRLIVERPERALRLMSEVRDLFRAGEFQALPVRVFAPDQVADAFRHLAQAKHIGKVVLSLEDAAAAEIPPAEAEVSFRPDATYLVVGGLGGVGLKLAVWLADHGARHLVLVGRSGAATAEARRVTGELARRGVTVRAVAADVRSRPVVDALLADVAATPAPLRGVFHAAMVLDDGPALNLDAERYGNVMEPKALGAWHLHAATVDVPLDHFVLFSSVVAELGNVGQAAYAAANAFLDALACYRRGRGLPALSINWGAFADAGVLARNERLAQHLTRQGWNGMPVRRALDCLGVLLNRVAPQVGVADVDWPAWGRAAPAMAASPRFADLMATAVAPVADGPGEGDWRPALVGLEPAEQLVEMQRRVREAVARVLGFEPDKLDTQRRLDQMGLDSLMAVELQHVLRQRTGLEITAVDMMGGPSVTDLAKLLLSRMALPATANGAAAAVSETHAERASSESVSGS